MNRRVYEFIRLITGILFGFNLDKTMIAHEIHEYVLLDL